jgi:hypothetical protein
MGNQIVLIGVPSRYRRKVTAAIRFALDAARKSLKYTRPIGVAVFEAPKDQVISGLGLAGSAIGKAGIEIRINFDKKTFGEKSALELKASISHEATHLVRENSVGYGLTLLDALVSEGVACYFEKYLFPARKIPYIAPIKGELKFLKHAQTIFNRKDFSYSDWFFGSKNIPKWAGYRVGYLLVKNFAEKKSIPLSELARMPSDKFLKN